MEWFKRISGGAWGVAIIALVGAAFWPGKEATISPVVAEQVEKAAAVSENRIMIHVSGEVVNPGLYQLAPSSRAQDAVAAAGGFLPNADVSRVNMAKRLKDGMQVRVPAMKNAGTAHNAGQAFSASGRTGTGNGGGTAQSRSAAAPGGQAVSLNHGDEQALCSLPGIGPATAQKIIAYRTAHGPFSRVDDLAAVAGIGPSKLAAVRPLVTLD